MLPGQSEGGLGVVNGRLFPIRRVMALGAVLTIGTLVLVIFLVAGVAGSGRALKYAVYVTVSARGGDVFPGQRECRLGVVNGRLFPIRGVMALGTVLPV